MTASRKEYQMTGSKFDAVTIENGYIFYGLATFNFCNILNNSRQIMNALSVLFNYVVI